MDALNLPEKLLLLALDDEKGHRQASYVDYALAGAAVAELILRGILVPSTNQEGRFEWGDKTPTNDPFLDRCIELIEKKGVGKPPKSLVTAIGQKSKVSQPLVDRLVERGVLHRVHEKVFFFFTRTLHPEADPSHEQSLKSRLSQVMFQGEAPEAEDAVLIALAKQLDLLKRNFDRTSLDTHKTRINDIAKGEGLVGDATKRAIQAVKSAIMVAAIVPAVVVSTG